MLESIPMSCSLIEPSLVSALLLILKESLLRLTKNFRVEVIRAKSVQSSAVKCCVIIVHKSSSGGHFLVNLEFTGFMTVFLD